MQRAGVSLVLLLAVILSFIGCLASHGRAWSLPFRRRGEPWREALAAAKVQYAAQRETHWERWAALVRQRTVSSEIDNEEEFQRATDLLRRWLAEEAGCVDVQVVRRDNHSRPAVLASCGFGDASATDTSSVSSILFYGHYDVQPASAVADGWTVTDDAFAPVTRDGKLYGRGVSDDKGGVMALLAALHTMRAVEQSDLVDPHHRGSRRLCVKVLFEGEEEIGSPSLTALIAQHPSYLFGGCDRAADAIATPVQAVISVDGGQFDERTAQLVCGMRGAAAWEVVLHGAARDVHSGAWGGAVPNPAQALAMLVAALYHAENHSVAVPGFYDGVLPPAERYGGDHERFLRAASRAMPPERQLATHLGVSALGGGERSLYPHLVDRLWFRPTLEVVGMGSGYYGPGIKTAIPARATLKLSMRLVPGQRRAAVLAAVRRYVERFCAMHLQAMGIRCEQYALPFAADPYELPIDHPLNRLLEQVLRGEYSRRVLPMRSGASIPALSMLQEAAEPAPVGTLAFSTEADNLHGPDESMTLSRFDKAVATYLHLLYRMRFEAVFPPPPPRDEL
eukprot:ctg_1014.g317